MYRVKTRNWHGRGWVKSLLDVSLRLGAVADHDYGDHDVKYWAEIRNPAHAWALWLYFMTLRVFSGGWTYIIRPGRELRGGTYSSIY